jgi:hypothetical protein
MKKIIAGAAVSAALMILPTMALADTFSVNFESSFYTIGNINDQDGWTALGSAGSGCAVYDEGVSSSLSTTNFGSQSFRISNSITSGCFGDQAFAKPLNDSVGESIAMAGTFATGTKQPHFEMEFDVASAVPGAEQPNLFVSVSPDRGDGSRMSYLGFADTSTGLNVIFYDVQGVTNPSNFVQSNLGTYSRSVAHHIKLTMDTLEGPSNDVVKVWIDGVLVHTGTSWENYYRYDAEASAEQSPRVVKTVIFRAGGTAAPATAGNGFLFDNLSLLSGPIPAPVLSTKSQCMNAGWKTVADTDGYSFRNQGDCVSFVSTKGNNAAW